MVKEEDAADKHHLVDRYGPLKIHNLFVRECVPVSEGDTVTLHDI